MWHGGTLMTRQQMMSWTLLRLPLGMQLGVQLKVPRSLLGLLGLPLRLPLWLPGLPLWLPWLLGLPLGLLGLPLGLPGMLGLPLGLRKKPNCWKY
jgi:hypothetical protein